MVADLSSHKVFQVAKGEGYVKLCRCVKNGVKAQCVEFKGKEGR